MILVVPNGNIFIGQPHILFSKVP